MEKALGPEKDLSKRSEKKKKRAQIIKKIFSSQTRAKKQKRISVLVETSREACEILIKRNELRYCMPEVNKKKTLNWT